MDKYCKYNHIRNKVLPVFSFVLLHSVAVVTDSALLFQELYSASELHWGIIVSSKECASTVCRTYMYTAALFFLPRGHALLAY